MPPRWLCAVIVAVWLATTARLLTDDLLPRLLPGTPPSFTIDLVEEAQGQKPFTFWTVYRNGEKHLQARTQVKHTAHDTFELTADYTPHEKGKQLVAVSGVLVRRMVSAYTVNGDGDLLGVRATIDGQPDVADWLKVVETDFRAAVEGEVVAGKMAPTLSLRATGLERNLTLPEVSVPRGGALLLPLQPVNRLRGLVPGQAWTLRLFDPIADSLRALQGFDTEPRLLRAAVRPRAEPMEEGPRRGEPCHVIDYRGDGFEATTWVSTRTGLVLSQEATLGRVRWAMVRD